MSVGTVTPRGRKISVEFDAMLADAIDAASSERSTPYRKTTASDIVREAVARFLLLDGGTNSSVHGTNTTAVAVAQGKLASEESA
jgi:metal-responsive CopG/Arc/MetJ family transcriptional regulator